MYDDTKLRLSITAWLEERCVVGYGSVYAGDLLADFENFIEQTKMMNDTPGPVPFGRMLKEQEFTRKRVAGLTHWCGLKLKNKTIHAPQRRYAKTTERRIVAGKRREAEEKRVRNTFLMTDKQRAARKKKVLDEMKHETAERNRAAGEEV